jgi:hypothetical protein
LFSVVAGETFDTRKTFFPKEKNTYSTISCCSFLTQIVHVSIRGDWKISCYATYTYNNVFHVCGGRMMMLKNVLALKVPQFSCPMVDRYLPICRYMYLPICRYMYLPIIHWA